MNRREWATMIGVGISLATFIFCGFLAKYLPHPRPSAPDPVRGYTSSVSEQFGQYFATAFEQTIAGHALVLILGAWIIVGTLQLRVFFRKTKMPRNFKNGTLIAGAVSILLYVFLWWT